MRHELRAQPEQLRIITIDGNSMEPLLTSGDRILVDTSQRVPVPPVIWDGMGLVAKRAEHVPNSDPPRIVIKSQNPEYSTYERDAEVWRTYLRATIVPAGVGINPPILSWIRPSSTSRV